MGLLKNNTKKEVRFKNKVFTLLEPNAIQKEEIVKIISNQSKVYEDKIEIEADLTLFRYFFKEMTNIGGEVDEYTDEELSDMLDNANKELKDLIRALTDLIEEIGEDLMYLQIAEIKKLSGIFDMMDTKDDIAKLKKKYNKIAKKYKLNMDFDELFNGLQNPKSNKEIIGKILEEINR